MHVKDEQAKNQACPVIIFIQKKQAADVVQQKGSVREYDQNSQPLSILCFGVEKGQFLRLWV